MDAKKQFDNDQTRVAYVYIQTMLNNTPNIPEEAADAVSDVLDAIENLSGGLTKITATYQTFLMNDATFPGVEICHSCGGSGEGQIRPVCDFCKGEGEINPNAEDEAYEMDREGIA